MENQVSRLTLLNFSGLSGFVPSIAALAVFSSSDHMRSKKWLTHLTLLLVLSVSALIPAWAVDGVIEINDARVKKNNGNYPFVISQSGSYRLTGNLMPALGQVAISITVNDVTLDLNGFAIIGPGAGTASGVTVMASQTNITVRNGTIKSMGGTGIIAGNFARVEKVQLINNLGSGVFVASFSTVSGNIVSGNGLGGISVGQGSTVSGNTVNQNARSGILLSAGGCTVAGNTAFGNGTDATAPDRDGINGNNDGNTVIGNTARNNAGTGLRLGATSGFTNNVLTGNGDETNGAQRVGGIMMGVNICGTAVCQ
jgi:parallel beta-helix repeat protein